MAQRDDIKFIAVDGIVKRDNTALAKALSSVMHAEPMLEENAVTPMIDFQSSDPKDFLFKKHILRLIDRYKQQRQLRQTEIFYERVVTDYLFYTDRIYANLKLDSGDLQIYEALLDSMEKELPIPDMVIYLQSNPETVMDKLATNYGLRGKHAIDAAYIQSLNDEFNQFFLHFAWSPVLIVNGNQFHPSDHRLTQGLLQKISKHDGGIAYYNPPVME